MAQSIRMVVYDSQIADLFDPGGDVDEACHDWTRTVQQVTRDLAPKRTGRLAAGIKTEYDHTKRFGVTGRVISRAPYTRYVNDGTTGPIWANGADGMLRVPIAKGTEYPKMWRPYVEGQVGQHFMERGLEQGMGLRL